MTEVLVPCNLVQYVIGVGACNVCTSDNILKNGLTQMSCSDLSVKIKLINAKWQRSPANPSGRIRLVIAHWQMPPNGQDKQNSS